MAGHLSGRKTLIPRLRWHNFHHSWEGQTEHLKVECSEHHKPCPPGDMPQDLPPLKRSYWVSISEILWPKLLLAAAVSRKWQAGVRMAFPHN